MDRRKDSTDVEAALLGSVLLLEDAQPYCLPKVEATDFASDFHQKVYSVMNGMFENGERIDEVTFRRKMKCSAADMVCLTDAATVPRNYPIYLKMVQRDADQRHLARALEDASIMARDGDQVAAWDVVESTRERLSRTDDDQVYAADRLMSASLDVADAYVQGRASVLGVPTGWRSIDEIVGGLVPGNMWVVAARPGKGKSAFAANLLVNVAKQGERSALVSLEMSAQEIGMRLLCREAKVNWEGLREGRVEDGTALVDAGARLAQLPMHVIDQPRTTVGTLRAICKDLSPAVVIVDYVQLMSGQERNNREQEVAAISRGLKLLAREEGTCVVALAQLNRNVEMRGEGASPQLSDLRDSGALEQDPDIVAFLVPRNGSWASTNLHVEVAKNRNGAAKAAVLDWDKVHVDMSDLGAAKRLHPAATAPHLAAAVPVQYA